MKLSRKLFFFVLGLRWISVIIGMSFLSLKIIVPEKNFMNTLYFSQPAYFLLGLFVFEIAISLFQYLKNESNQTVLITTSADVILGMLVLYGLGSSFFLLSVALPVIEAFLLLESLGIPVAIIGLMEILAIIIKLMNPGGAAPEKGNSLVGISLFISQALLGALALWICLIARKQENDLELRHMLEKQDKETYHKEIEASQKEIERLYHHMMTAQAELEKLKTKQTIAVQPKPEIQKPSQASPSQEMLNKLNDMSKELQALRKERESLNFLVESSGQMHNSLNLEETLIQVVEMIEKVIPTQTCLIFLIEEENQTKKLYAEVAASPYADYFRNYHVNLGEGVVGWVVTEKETTIIENGSLKTADGREFTTLVNSEKSAIVTPLLLPNQTPLGVVYLGEAKQKAFSWQDVNVLLRLVPHIQAAIAKSQEYHRAVAQGIVDSFTGLYNRIYFEERLSEEVKRAYRYQQNLSLIYLQIDHYEETLSNLDEALRKEILNELAELLKGYVRDFDVLSRIDNGRFAMLLVQAERSNAVMIAERIRLAIELRTFGEKISQKIKFTSSIGVASYPKDALYKSDLLTKCEAVLQEAIAKGGNKTCIAA